jgi:hypothetical protein
VLGLCRPSCLREDDPSEWCTLFLVHDLQFFFDRLTIVVFRFCPASNSFRWVRFCWPCIKFLQVGSFLLATLNDGRLARVKERDNGVLARDRFGGARAPRAWQHGYSRSL